jgi:peptide/nickel transport system substrate-binding protein
MNSLRILVVLTIVLLLIVISAQYSRPTLAQSAGKILLIAVHQEPTSMDPSLVYVGGDYPVVSNYGEYLIDKAPNGDLRPGLATSWKMSPDGKEIEFTLRKGVKFHSGDIFTAKDVEFSFDRGKTKNPTTRTRLNLMERFEVIDDYHLKIHFKTPDVTFIPNRAGGAVIVSKTYYDRVGEEKFVKNPVGTGPYKFARYVPGECVDIERFDDYWSEKPSVKEARFYFVPEDATRLAKLKSGEVDLITNCPYPSVKDVENTPGLKIVKLSTNHPTASVIFSIPNSKVPWHDRRVRLAMAYAIDWKTIVDKVLYGIPNHWVFLDPRELGYDSNLKPYAYDPRRARELLSEAGYPKGFDLKLYWVISGGFPMAREGAESVASYFEAVGIRTKLIGEEWAAAQARRRSAKVSEAALNVEYVSFLSEGRSGGSDPSYNLDLFYTKGGGFSVYSNPEIEKLTAEAKATVDDLKRGELIKKAVRIIHEDVATIPVFNTVAVYAMKTNIEFKPTQKHAQDLLLIRDVTMR